MMARRKRRKKKMSQRLDEGPPCKLHQRAWVRVSVSFAQIKKLLKRLKEILR